MKIPFVDLKTQYQSIQGEIAQSIQSVLDRGDFILGQSVSEFEKEFSQAMSAPYAVGCASGTDALILALKAYDIGPGDEVISVSNTWVSTIFAISHVGATPVFADIDPDTYLIDPAKIEEKISPKTKAILPVHLYGQACDMEQIQSIAKKHQLVVIGDAAQAHLSEWDNMSVALWSDITCYSFYPGKNLGAYGDAGAIVTEDEKVAGKIKMLRNMGQKQKHDHEYVAWNSRLDSIQAAILKTKLKHLNDWTEKRRQAASRYDQLLKDLPCKTPQTNPKAKHVYHLYIVQTDERDQVLKSLQEKGVMTQIHYPVPVHLQKCYENLNLGKGLVPVTEKIADKIFSLPLFPEITPEQQAYVADTLSETLKLIPSS